MANQSKRPAGDLPFFSPFANTRYLCLLTKCSFLTEIQAGWNTKIVIGAALGEKRDKLARAKANRLSACERNPGIARSHDAFSFQ